MTTVDEVKQVLREEMDKRGWHDNDWRAGLAAIIGGESHFNPHFETGYAHTSNARIRKIFPSRVHGLSDAQIDEVKATDRSWFSFVYGGRFGNRPGTDDGFIYRGGGLNQLTFHDNYALYGPKVGVDLIAHPEMVNVPRVAAALAVEYMKDRFHGGDFDDMKKAVGVSIGEPDEEKNRLYDLYTRTGEWDYTPGQTMPVDEPPPPPVGMDPVMANFLNSLHAAEAFLKHRGLYTGPVDDDPGPGVRAAVKAYLKTVRN